MSAAGSPPLGDVAIATVAPATAGATHVALTIRLRAELQCGRLNAPKLVVRLPVAMRVPASLRRSSVTVSGRQPAKVEATGRTTVVIIPTRPGVTCFVIAPGVVRIRFDGSAGLGNPLTAGTYAFSVTASHRTWHGTFRVT